jgi:hypothetical protein
VWAIGSTLWRAWPICAPAAATAVLNSVPVGGAAGRAEPAARPSASVGRAAGSQRRAACPPGQPKNEGPPTANGSVNLQELRMDLVDLRRAQVV